MDDDRDHKSKKDHEGNALWQAVMRTVRPLKGAEKIAERAAGPTPELSPRRPDSRHGLAPGPDLSRLPLLVPGLAAPQGAADEAAPGGIDRRTADRLRRGKLPIEGVLDLHGLRQDEAQVQLTDFLTRAHRSGRRCVLVITGKGQRGDTAHEGGILRRMLPVWLARAPLADKILLHSPAQPKDGGSGAFYILLRRQR